MQEENARLAAAQRAAGPEFDEDFMSQSSGGCLGVGHADRASCSCLCHADIGLHRGQGPAAQAQCIQ